MLFFKLNFTMYCCACCTGYLSAELRNANGTVPVDVVRRDRDRYAISFVPLVEGRPNDRPAHGSRASCNVIKVLILVLRTSLFNTHMSVLLFQLTIFRAFQRGMWKYAV